MPGKSSNDVDALQVVGPAPIRFEGKTMETQGFKASAPAHNGRPTAPRPNKEAFTATPAGKIQIV